MRDILQRIRKTETRATGVPTVHPQLAVHIFHNQLADGKAQSASLHKIIQLFKAFKNQVLLFRWNATSGIRHGEKSRIDIVHLQFQHDGALFRKLGGIHQQVYQDLAETRIVRIQHQDGQIRVKTHFNLQLARDHHGLHDLITQLHGIMRADVEGYIVILEIREIQNVIDKFQTTERNSP